MATTRLLPIGIQGQPTGSFAGKSEAAPPTHPFIDGTRLTQMAIMGRPYLGFDAKDPSTGDEDISQTRGPYLVNIGRGMM